jgi:hypothetical protein
MSSILFFICFKFIPFYFSFLSGSFSLKCYYTFLTFEGLYWTHTHGQELQIHMKPTSFKVWALNFATVHCKWNQRSECIVLLSFTKRSNIASFFVFLCYCWLCFRLYFYDFFVCPIQWLLTESLYNWRSVSRSVLVGAHDHILIIFWKLQSCQYGAPSLTRGRVCLLSLDKYSHEPRSLNTSCGGSAYSWYTLGITTGNNHISRLIGCADITRMTIHNNKHGFGDNDSVENVMFYMNVGSCTWSVMWVRHRRHGSQCTRQSDGLSTQLTVQGTFAGDW